MTDEERSDRGQQRFMKKLRVTTGGAQICRPACEMIVGPYRLRIIHGLDQDRTHRPRSPTGTLEATGRDRRSSSSRRTSRSNDSTPTRLPSESRIGRRRDASNRHVSGRSLTIPRSEAVDPGPATLAPAVGLDWPTPGAPIRIIRNEYAQSISAFVPVRYDGDAHTAAEAPEEGTAEGLGRRTHRARLLRRSRAHHRRGRSFQSARGLRTRGGTRKDRPMEEGQPTRRTAGEAGVRQGPLRRRVSLRTRHSLPPLWNSPAGGR